MKATELMIGDWVYNTHHKKPIKWNYGEMFAPNLQPVIGRDLEPIPLTEEVPKANGFKKDTTGYYYLKYGNWWLVFCGRKEYSWLEIRTTKYGGTLLANMRPTKGYEYVHELQHALRLCGLNELADNFKIKAIKE